MASLYEKGLSVIYSKPVIIYTALSGLGMIGLGLYSMLKSGPKKEMPFTLCGIFITIVGAFAIITAVVRMKRLTKKTLSTGSSPVK